VEVSLERAQKDRSPEGSRAELVERGVEVGQVVHRADGAWVEGRGGRWNSFVFFSDPDGNG